MHYAALSRNFSMIQMLHQVAKIDLNCRNKFDVTPLHVSAYAFNEKKDFTPALERYLLANKADPKALDSDLRTPAFYLFFKGKQIEAGQTNDPASLLMTLLRDGSLGHYELAQADRMGNTLLHFAAMAGANICSLTLLNSGAALEPVNLIGNTPYSLALAHS